KNPVGLLDPKAFQSAERCFDSLGGTDYGDCLAEIRGMGKVPIECTYAFPGDEPQHVALRHRADAQRLHKVADYMIPLQGVFVKAGQAYVGLAGQCCESKP